MLRQAARRCAQARRTLARPLAPSRVRLHSSTESSRSKITSRDVFLGTTAAAVGFGIWRYFAGPSNVHLDAEDVPTKTKNPSRESDSVPPEDSSDKATTTSGSADFATTSSSTHEIVETMEHETQASDVGESSETPHVTEGEEGSSTGAFNPVTGEINWDCPCLGGMAHGPCGPDFREAFSCFVYSEEEPKGINCVEKFRAMQDCFRAHPDVYGEEIMRDDDEEDIQGVTPPDQEKAPDAASSDSTPSTSSPSS